MLENIFGLHLGCEVYVEFAYERGILVEIGRDHIHLKNHGNRRFPLNYCKLILKPLSSISDEDKREFKKTFGYGFVWFGIYNEELYLFAPNGEPMAKVSETEKLWLRSRGYNIPDGLVPDKYKIVEG